MYRLPRSVAAVIIPLVSVLAVRLLVPVPVVVAVLVAVAVLEAVAVLAILAPPAEFLFVAVSVECLLLRVQVKKKTRVFQTPFTTKSNLDSDSMSSFPFRVISPCALHTEQRPK